MSHRGRLHAYAEAVAGIAVEHAWQIAQEYEASERNILLRIAGEAA